MSDDLTPAIPCPFCGAVPGIDDVIGEYNEGCLYVRLRCPNGDQECMAEGPWDNVIEDVISPEGLYEVAVARWNHRYESPELPGWLKDKISHEKYHLNLVLAAKLTKHPREIVEAIINRFDWILSLRRDQP
jgi:hypothetical protein